MCLPPARTHFCELVAGRVGPRFEAGEDVLERHHAGVDEHQGRVVVRHQRRRRHPRVAVLLEIIEEGAADVVGRGHDRRCKCAAALRQGRGLGSALLLQLAPLYGETARVDHPELQAQTARSGSVLGRILGWIVKLVLAFLVISVLWVLAYRFVNPPITVTMLGDMFAGRGATRDWMPISQIDRDMVRAAIAAEDSKFCSHNGFDFEAIEDAMKRNASGGRIRGGSTISQQTAKNAFLWQGGGYARKGVEAWFTFLIEHLWGKRRIMEVYLNLAETGIGTYGVNAGSSAISAMTRAR